MKTKEPNRHDSNIEEDMKTNLMQEFSQITHSWGRQLLKDLGVLIVPESEIANVIIFDAMRKEKETKFSTKEEVKESHKGVKYRNDHKALVIWCIQIRDKARIIEVLDVVHMGSLVEYKVREVDSEQVSKMSKEMADFGVEVVAKDKNKFLELNANFEKFLVAYEERGRRINEMEKVITNLQKKQGKRKVGEEPNQLLIASSLALPPPTGPMVEIPNTPQHQGANN